MLAIENFAHKVLDDVTAELDAPGSETGHEAPTLEVIHILHSIYLCQSTMSSILIFHFLMHNIHCNFFCCYEGKERSCFECQNDQEENAWREAAEKKAEKIFFTTLDVPHKKDISVTLKLCTKCCANCFLFTLSLAHALPAPSASSF